MLTGAALLGVACETDGSATETAAPPAHPFKEGTGWFYHYVRETMTLRRRRYDGITANDQR